MQLKKSILTLALSCAVMALPALAQDSSHPSPDQQTPTASQSGSMAGQSSTPGQAAGDSTAVQSSVQSALQKDTELAGQSVNAEVSGQKITLSGSVSSQAQKDRAEQVATQAAGSGYTVKNKIKVGSAGASGSTGSTSNPQK